MLIYQWYWLSGDPVCLLLWSVLLLELWMQGCGTRASVDDLSTSSGAGCCALKRFFLFRVFWRRCDLYLKTRSGTCSVGGLKVLPDKQKYLQPCRHGDAAFWKSGAAALISCCALMLPSCFWINICLWCRGRTRYFRLWLHKQYLFVGSVNCWLCCFHGNWWRSEKYTIWAALSLKHSNPEKNESSDKWQTSCCISLRKLSRREFNSDNRRLSSNAH